MRFLTASVFVLGLVSAFYVSVHAAEFAVTQDLVDLINSNPESSWTAGHNQFSHMTVEEAKRLLKTVNRQSKRHSSHVPSASAKHVESLSLPSSFDARNEWPTCIHPVRDQQQCGSCWAFSASEVLSDRFCIASQGKTNVVLSPGDLVGCDTADGGCNGGMLNTAWEYMTYSGLALDSCIPYTSGNGTTQSCPSTCVDGSPIKRYKAEGAKQISGGLFFWMTVPDIQKALMTGPVQAAFSVYQDFLAYKSGIYVHTSGELLGGHAIEVIGWTTDPKLGVAWLCKNSWNTSWGDAGYFLIQHAQCGISDDVWAGTPVLA